MGDDVKEEVEFVCCIYLNPCVAVGALVSLLLFDSEGQRATPGCGGLTGHKQERAEVHTTPFILRPNYDWLIKPHTPELGRLSQRARGRQE